MDMDMDVHLARWKMEDLLKTVTIQVLMKMDINIM
jgi:hypothetical protein